MDARTLGEFLLRNLLFASHAANVFAEVFANIHAARMGHAWHDPARGDQRRLVVYRRQFVSSWLLGSAEHWLLRGGADKSDGVQNMSGDAALGKLTGWTLDRDLRGVIGSRRIKTSIAILGFVAVGTILIETPAPAQEAVSPDETKRQLAALAAQANANPPNPPNAKFLSAEARGLTFFLHLRSTVATSPFADEKFVADTVTAQCRSQQLRSYTDRYGIALEFQIDAASGNGAHRFRIDRDICLKAAGPSTFTNAALPPIAAPPIAASSAVLPVNSAGGCAGYLGRTVSPVSFDAAIAAFARLTPKSEYETTAQFEARRDAALGGGTGPLVIEKAPERADLFQYDADAQTLLVSPYVFSNSHFPAWQAFYAAGLSSAFNVSTLDNIDVVMADSDRVTGSYRATNGFGATTTVVSVTRSMKVIFERGSQLGRVRERLFPGSITDDYKVNPVGRLRMAPDEARLLKPNLRIAFVAAPRPPYLVKGSTKYGKTTIQNPRDVTLDFTILTADIQCGLLMDGGGRVIGAYPTA